MARSAKPLKVGCEVFSGLGPRSLLHRWIQHLLNDAVKTSGQRAVRPPGKVVTDELRDVRGKMLVRHALQGCAGDCELVGVCPFLTCFDRCSACGVKAFESLSTEKVPDAKREGSVNREPIQGCGGLV